MKKFFLFLVGFLIGVIVFMPKDNLYYTLQKYLEKDKIYINSDIKTGINLILKDGIIYYKGMDVSKFENIKIIPFIFYNEIDIKKLVLNIGNYKIDDAKVLYTLFYPVKVFINGESNFGKIKGEINLVKKEIKVYIKNLTDNSLKRFLRKDKKGYYYYAKF